MPIKLNVEKIGHYTGHRDSVYALCAGASDHEFYSAGGDGLTVKWNLEIPDTGWPGAKTEKSVYAIAYNKVARNLWVAENYHGLHKINTSAGREVKNLQLTESAIFDLLLSDKHAVICTGDGRVMLLSKEDGTLLYNIKLSADKLRCLALHPDGGMLAVAGSDKGLRILSFPELKIVHEVPRAHLNSVFTCAFSPCGKFLLTGGRDATLKIWDAAGDFKLLDSIVAHMYCINHISYSRCGKYFATCSMDKSVKVWNAHDFRLLKVIDKARHAGHGTSVNKLLWPGPEGILVSTGDDRSISVWKLTEPEA